MARNWSTMAITASTDLADVASALGMNWDSENSVMYMEDSSNGFNVTLSGTSISFKPRYNSANQNNATTISEGTLYYIKADTGNACLFGGYYGSGTINLAMGWVKGEREDGTTDYAYFNLCNSSTAWQRSFWGMNSYLDMPSFWQSVTMASSLQFVTLAPVYLATPFNMYTPDLFIQSTGNVETNPSLFALGGYDYARGARNNNAMAHIVLRLGKS